LIFSCAELFSMVFWILNLMLWDIGVLFESWGEC
jgi:hypothetical protein